MMPVDVLVRDGVGETRPPASLRARRLSRRSVAPPRSSPRPGQLLEDSDAIVMVSSLRKFFPCTEARRERAELGPLRSTYRGMGIPQPEVVAKMATPRTVCNPPTMDPPRRPHVGRNSMGCCLATLTTTKTRTSTTSIPVAWRFSLVPSWRSLLPVPSRLSRADRDASASLRPPLLAYDGEAPRPRACSSALIELVSHVRRSRDPPRRGRSAGG